MTKRLCGMLLFVCILSSAHSQGLDQPQLVKVLSCIRQKGPDIGAALPHFDNESVRFRYHAGEFHLHFPSGKVISQDRHDEVRMAVYGPNENTLIIYDVFLEEKNGFVVIVLGDPASFSRNNDQWIAGDNPGGMATNLYMKTLVKKFSLQTPYAVPLKSLEMSLQNGSCTR